MFTEEGDKANLIYTWNIKYKITSEHIRHNFSFLMLLKCCLLFTLIDVSCIQNKIFRKENWILQIINSCKKEI